ncbi:glyoxylase-like metal-dependent hydrolase (beta-lactamase superfamily II) [Pseudorhodoferax soli]|uniref:Glyoxylase-like metal-dependent hydrolase (Beta-lactamase superfamily II) n=1 Tax=Pseudorhodoferax soli TaxID=545864 RepID=A0A368Y8N0_9BURK|nr:glyoxylase-like metal-dependent hydrolase (beta-lactamase superfamily II) [Pseudorhodoferax soli]
MAYLDALCGRAAVLALLCLACTGWAQPALVAERVAPAAWYVQGMSALGSPQNRNFISNAGFVATDDGVVAIDALGSPQLARAFMQEIRRVTGKAVTHVIVTHYHADHIYGLQEFQRAGARIVAHRGGLEYLHSELAASRLAASRTELAPWIDAQTHLVPADEWIDGPRELVVGKLRFVLMPVGPAHTPEDLAVFVPSQKLLFAGDLVFRGRVPFVGQARSGEWIEALTRLLALDAQAVVPGHGPVSRDARADMELTRDYLAYLRETMGRAARDMEPFDEAYARTDWSRFAHLPLFGAANRMNAYNTYLLMEREDR